MGSREASIGFHSWANALRAIWLGVAPSRARAARWRERRAARRSSAQGSNCSFRVLANTAPRESLFNRLRLGFAPPLLARGNLVAVNGVRAATHPELANDAQCSVKPSSDHPCRTSSPLKPCPASTSPFPFSCPRSSCSSKTRARPPTTTTLARKRLLSDLGVRASDLARTPRPTTPSSSNPSRPLREARTLLPSAATRKLGVCGQAPPPPTVGVRRPARIREHSDQPCV